VKIIDTSGLGESFDLTGNEKDYVYNGLDCCVTLEILHALLPQLDSVSQKTYDFSRALQAPVLDMSMRGVLTSDKKRREVLISFKRQIDEFDFRLTRMVFEGIGYPSAVNTTKQVRGLPVTVKWWRSTTKLKNLLYDVMGLPVQKKRRPNGDWGATVGLEALENLRKYFLAEPILLILIELRNLDKKRSFLEGEIDPDNVFRSNFNIAGTNTGRLASSSSDFGTGSNGQNVDRELRSTFVSHPKMKFANLDLEQGDARNVGAICWNLFVNSHGEEYAGAYLDACESGDLHTTVCRMAWRNLQWTNDAKANRVVAEQLAYRQDSYRQLAKKLGHGTNYYGTPGTMAKHTKVDKNVIEAFQHAYFTAFPAIGAINRSTNGDNYHSWVRTQLRDYRQITTPLGRRRFFFGRPEEDSTLREAIAYSPQSMTADEIDSGLLALWRRNICQLQLQVHDSILFQYPEHLENTILPLALKTLRLTIPLKKNREFIAPVDAKIGWNWGDYDPVTNPDGLVKYKGEDSRTRTEKSSKLLFTDILNEQTEA
jgi:hypothetical protein